MKGKLGRNVAYQSDDERPVSISVRLPRELYTKVEQYAHVHRMSISELVKDGLKMRLETPADPRDMRVSDDNTVMQQLQEMVDTAVQTALAKMQSTGLTLLTRASPDSQQSNGNTVLQEIPGVEAPVPAGMVRCKHGHAYVRNRQGCPTCKTESQRRKRQEKTNAQRGQA